MKRANSIVRTRTINKDERGDYYDIELMTYSKYLQRSEFMFMKHKIELYPYKWYDLRRLWEIPSYLIVLKFFRISEANIKIQRHKRISIIVLITEILALIKLITSIIFEIKN